MTIKNLAKLLVNSWNADRGGEQLCLLFHFRWWSVIVYEQSFWKCGVPVLSLHLWRWECSWEAITACWLRVSNQNPVWGSSSPRDPKEAGESHEGLPEAKPHCSLSSNLKIRDFNCPRFQTDTTAKSQRSIIENYLFSSLCIHNILNMRFGH